MGGRGALKDFSETLQLSGRAARCPTSSLSSLPHPCSLARTDSAPAPGAEGPDSESGPVRPRVCVWPPLATPRARHTTRALSLASTHCL